MGLFNRNEATVPRNATFRLTSAGRERLINYMSRPEDRILAALETCGTSDRDEISRASGLSRSAVERYLVILSQKGYIQRVGQGGGMSFDSGDLGDSDDADSPRKRRMMR